MITISTLHQHTAQQVFDQIATHLLKQGKRSMGPVTREHGGSSYDTVKCVYRGPDGVKCAAGAIIGDHEYEPSMEGAGWYHIAQAKDVYAHENIIMRMQTVHDTVEPHDWRQRLSALADELGLARP